MSALPLSGIRILDLTHFLAGPFASMILGDLGAEVIRIEHPTHLEEARKTPPHFMDGESVYFLSLNRNKKSITLDLKKEQGREVFLDLVRNADVVFDNFRPGVTERLGIDHAKLRLIKPDIICCSLSGFGMTGPFSDRPGYDYIMQGISGLMSLAGEPGTPPEKTGISVVDHVGGLYAVIAILASLVQKERKGTGQLSDVALLDSILSLFTYVAGFYLNAGDVPKKISASGHPAYVPVQNFETADGYIVLMSLTEKFWCATCRAIGKPEWADDPRFSSSANRLTHKQELLDLLIPLLKTKPSDYWLDALALEGVPSSPINTLAEGLEHPQVKARNMIVNVPHPVAGTFRTLGNPIKMPDKDTVYASPPLLGQHTEEVLAGLLAYSREKIVALRGQGVIR
ncbi:MAG: CoA transferase [Polaromonas sp.]|nr:CoA transferase [Polaromonas sp.]